MRTVFRKGLESKLNSEETKHIVEKFKSNKSGIKEQAVDIFLFGLLSEIFGKQTGFIRG